MVVGVGAVSVCCVRDETVKGLSTSVKLDVKESRVVCGRVRGGLDDAEVSSLDEGYPTTPVDGRASGQTAPFLQSINSNGAETA